MSLLLRLERNWLVSSPDSRPWEADHLSGRKEAAVQILIQTLEAAGSKSPLRSLPSLLTCCCPGPRANSAGPFCSSNAHGHVHTRACTLAPAIWNTRLQDTLRTGPPCAAPRGSKPPLQAASPADQARPHHCPAPRGAVSPGPGASRPPGVRSLHRSSAATEQMAPHGSS